MKNSEKKALIAWANELTDEELEKEYYDSIMDSLGSNVEEMYERGYDMQDIKERESFEKFLCEKSSVLEVLCQERGIKLWEQETEREW